VQKAEWGGGGGPFGFHFLLLRGKKNFSQHDPWSAGKKEKSRTSRKTEAKVRNVLGTKKKKKGGRASLLRTGKADLRLDTANRREEDTRWGGESS